MAAVVYVVVFVKVSFLILFLSLRRVLSVFFRFYLVLSKFDLIITLVECPI